MFDPGLQTSEEIYEDIVFLTLRQFFSYNTFSSLLKQSSQMSLVTVILQLNADGVITVQPVSETFFKSTCRPLHRWITQ